MSSEADQQVMGAIQSRFEVVVPELPCHIDPAGPKFLYSSVPFYEGVSPSLRYLK
jgi:hypothetical protein